ncbi:Uncharacterised protein [uncultured archaeon]|nr:Uncharacterised protein [uncultured archaeon]
MANRSILTLMLSFLLIMPSLACADLGPKPTMDFSLVYETSKQVQLLGGEQFECEDANCADIKPLLQVGPQRFTCESESCRSMAYGYSRYQKLVLNFSDRTRESNVFKSGAFSSNYVVRVRDDGLFVEDMTPPSVGRFLLFCVSLLVTLVLESVAALVFVVFLKLPRGRIVAFVAVANIISLPIVWLVFPLLGNAILVILLSEAFAVLFEAAFIHLLNKKILSLRLALALSIVTNLMSFVVGNILLWLSLSM